MNKQEAIVLLQELVKLDNFDDRKEDLKAVKREYKFILNKEDESFADRQESEEFLRLFNELAKKESSLLLSNYDEKKKVIEEVKKLVDRKDINSANKELDELSNEFKRIGRAGTKEQDDELWNEFREAKDAFFAKRREFYEARDAQNEAKREKKQDVIKRAKEVLEMESIKEAGDKLNDLRQEWKEIGYTGKTDDALWNEFKAVLDSFQEKRKAHHADMVKMFEDRAAKKEELIKTAKKILADSDFSDEEVAKIKNLRREYREIGFAGKEKDDDLYERFNAVINKYFEEMKFYKY